MSRRNPNSPQRNLIMSRRNPNSTGYVARKIRAHTARKNAGERGSTGLLNYRKYSEDKLIDIYIGEVYGSATRALTELKRRGWTEGELDQVTQEEAQRKYEGTEDWYYTHGRHTARRNGATFGAWKQTPSDPSIYQNSRGEQVKIEHSQDEGDTYRDLVALPSYELIASVIVGPGTMTAIADILKKHPTHKDLWAAGYWQE
jgi:hypothetical protein